MASQQSVLARFKERLADAGAVAATHPRRWRAFRAAVRVRRAANDNRPPLGLVIARILLVAALIAFGVAALV
ncbi:MAG: hypothetical protein ACM30I_15715 [Gemmatimonas sp.]